MNTMTHALGASAILASLASSIALAEVQCPPNLGPVTVDGVTVIGNCTLRGTDVDGDVVVQPGGRLLSQGADIEGSVLADRASRIRLLNDASSGEETQVDGNVEIIGTTSINREVSQIIDADIDGDVILQSNQIPVNVFTNDIDGSVMVLDNLRVVRLRDNDIEDDLVCRRNSPRPFDGGGNEVDGDVIGQCSSFDD